MEMLKKLISPFKRDTNFIKTMNYIITSDYNQSYLKKENINIINFFKWLYLFFIICAIAISFIPLVDLDAIGNNSNTILLLNIIMFIIFINDYFWRWITYSFRSNKKSKYPLLFFPFTGVSLILMFALLPSFITLFIPLIENNFSDTDVLKPFISVVQSLVILQLGRLLLLLNVIAPFRIFTNILEKQKKILFYVFLFLIIVTLLFSIVIYRAEIGKNDKIIDYWDAFYFTVISICTIGYGDIVPNTDLGRVMVIILAFVGVGIFTIPGAVIAAGFLDEIQIAKKENKNEEDQVKGISIVEKTITRELKRVKKIFKKKPNKNKEEE